ncbi:MAG: tetratricopeptide repeat protein [Gammaproteobacteria bacterium]|nr:tetratricopeptide repeat protein [Gammaproteobacteria bacterium]
MNNVNFENLVSISAVGAILVIASGFVSLAKQHPPQFISLQSQSRPALQTTTQVQGYRKPVSATENIDSPRQTITTQQNFLERLPKQQAELLIRRFDQAAALLHAGQYEYAIKALDQVIKIQPNMPEAYVNLGYAYLGIDDYVTAVNAFSKAIDFRPNQVNAYYGLAAAFEGVEDYGAALGAMHSYIHLSPADDPYITKARAAIWELETKLGRKPSIEKNNESIDVDGGRFTSPHQPQLKPQSTVRRNPHD